MTIVSGLDGQGGQSTEKLYLGGKDPARPVWGCLMPPKNVAEFDPVMAEARNALETQKVYGTLCASYVAVTRSRRALYIVTDRLPDRTDAKHFGRLLEVLLNPGSSHYQKGDWDWYEEKLLPNTGVAQEVSSQVSGVQAPLGRCTATIPHPVSPSSLAVKKAAKKFTRAQGDELDTLDAADLGTEIHDLLSRIEWDASQVDLSSCSKDARSLLEAFLKSAEAKAIFTKPVGEWDLWNEKPFDLMIDGQWISGCFDRVHVRREGGKAVEAHIYDYKTNRSTPAKIAEEYEGQMEQYRKAAALLLGLDVAQVMARTIPIRNR
jgi:ATP-dependent exoDNAse (exonuclease V) beta subunit